MTRRGRRRDYRLPRCRGKVAYPSERIAKRAGARCTKQRGTDLRAYECPVCGGWHLTKRLALGYEPIRIGDETYWMDADNLETWQ